MKRILRKAAWCIGLPLVGTALFILFTLWAYFTICCMETCLRWMGADP